MIDPVTDAAWFRRVVYEGEAKALRDLARVVDHVGKNAFFTVSGLQVAGEGPPVVLTRATRVAIRALQLAARYCEQVVVAPEIDTDIPDPTPPSASSATAPPTPERA